MSAPWPTFRWDSNSASGLIDSRERWRWLVDRLDFFGNDAAVSRVLGARLATRERSYSTADGLTQTQADLANARVAVEAAARDDVPSFGWRREHGGDLTLGEWLRAQGCDVVPEDWRPTR